MNAHAIKDYEEVRNWHAFEGPLGDVVHNGRSFFPWKDGRPLGAYRTLEEAMEALRLGSKGIIHRRVTL
jgi:hypothetical protein